MDEYSRIVRLREALEEARKAQSSVCHNVNADERTTLIAKVRHAQITEVLELLDGQRASL